jgi:NADH-quinone oxidoreductase subunit N
MSLASSLQIMFPEIVMALGAMALLMTGAISGGASRSDNQITLGEKSAATISWGAIVVMVLAEFAVAMGSGGPAFGGAFIADSFARFAKLLILIGAALSVLLAEEFFSDLKSSRFELPVLMLIATLGMMLMV